MDTKQRRSLESSGAEARLANLQKRFRKSLPPPRRKQRQPGPTSYAALFIAILFCIGVGLPATHAVQQFGSLDLASKHMTAAANCDTARRLNLAPAHRGEPGYWPHLDRDKDGIACEPIPQFKRKQ